MTTGRIARSILLVSVALAIAFAVRWVRQGAQVARETDPLAAYERALDERITQLRDAAASQRGSTVCREDQRALVLDLALKRYPAAAGCGARAARVSSAACFPGSM